MSKELMDCNLTITACKSHGKCLGHELHRGRGDTNDIDEYIAKRVSSWFGEPVLAVEDEIRNLIAQETNKARLDEIENFHWANIAERDDRYGSQFIVFSEDLHKLKNDRIKALKAGGKDE